MCIEVEEVHWAREEALDYHSRTICWVLAIGGGGALATTTTGRAICAGVEGESRSAEATIEGIDIGGATTPSEDYSSSSSTPTT